MIDIYPGVENELLSVQIAMSHDVTNWQPAAVATPSTAAIIGTGLLVIACINCEHVSKISLWSFSLLLV